MAPSAPGQRTPTAKILRHGKFFSSRTGLTPRVKAITQCLPAAAVCFFIRSSRCEILRHVRKIRESGTARNDTPGKSGNPNHLERHGTARLENPGIWKIRSGDPTRRLTKILRRDSPASAAVTTQSRTSRLPSMAAPVVDYDGGRRARGRHRWSPAPLPAVGGSADLASDRDRLSCLHSLHLNSLLLAALSTRDCCHSPNPAAPPTIETTTSAMISPVLLDSSAASPALSEGSGPATRAARLDALRDAHGVQVVLLKCRPGSRTCWGSPASPWPRTQASTSCSESCRPQ